MAEHSPAKLVPIDAAVLPQVGAFLTERFRPGPDDHFGDLEYLRWQYLEWPKGPGPRAHNCISDNKILAHVGTVYSRFLLGGTPSADWPVGTTIHSWVSTPNAGPLGTMLLWQSFRTSEVQYAFSFSPKAKAILDVTGYTLRQVIPGFRRVRRMRSWNRVYAGSPMAKRTVFLMQELALAFRRVFLPTLRPLELERVAQFDERAEALAAAAARHCLLTERHSLFLNHLLRYPFGETRGYYLRHEGGVVGLALLHFWQRDGLCQARVLDCLLGEPDAVLCARALAALEKEMEARKADVALGIGGTPWLAAGYRRAGYVRRGRKPLLIRDPRQRLPPGIPVHMALVDSDLAFIS
jgi:hypothetical protein